MPQPVTSQLNTAFSASAVHLAVSGAKLPPTLTPVISGSAIMSTYAPAATSPLMTRPRAHTHTSADTGSPANLVPPSFVPSRPPGAVRAQGPPHGHPGQRTVSASVMDVANRGFVPPSPG